MSGSESAGLAEAASLEVHATVQALGDGDWRPSMNWLDVIELLGE
jgi:hypothetical protein